MLEPRCASLTAGGSTKPHGANGLDCTQAISELKVPLRRENFLGKDYPGFLASGRLTDMGQFRILQIIHGNALGGTSTVKHTPCHAPPSKIPPHFFLKFPDLVFSSACIYPYKESQLWSSKGPVKSWQSHQLCSQD